MDDLEIVLTVDTDLYTIEPLTGDAYSPGFRRLDAIMSIPLDPPWIPDTSYFRSFFQPLTFEDDYL